MDTNPQPLRSVTFREPVRLPGSSMTGHYIPSEDYPLTYFPTLSLVRATLRPGVQPMPNQSRTRYYGISVVKDMELLYEPAETAVREVNGALTVEHQVKTNADGSFERVVAEPDAGIMPLKPGIDPPKAKRSRKAKASEDAPAPGAPPAQPIAPVITRPLPRTTAGTGASGGGV